VNVTGDERGVSLWVFIPITHSTPRRRLEADRKRAQKEKEKEARLMRLQAHAEAVRSGDKAAMSTAFPVINPFSPGPGVSLRCVL
jgi:hypothetical protein